MTLQRISPATHEEWLELRQRQGVGASQAAAIAGFSPWQTSTDLWRQIVLGEKPKDISDNPAVEKGNRMEPALRAMFAALHPELVVEHHPYDLLFQAERPHFFCTLDGELTDADGRQGILEIKTSTPGGKWSDWADGHIPQGYYIQIIAQLLSTKWDFVYLFACLFGLNGDITLREYQFEREDCLPDMEWLAEREDEFWRHVERGTMPPLALTL